MLANPQDTFTKAVLKAIGLKNVRKVSIFIEVDQVTTVEAEFYAEDLSLLTKKFELSATSIDDAAPVEEA